MPPGGGRAARPPQRLRAGGGRGDDLLRGSSAAGPGVRGGARRRAGAGLRVRWWPCCAPGRSPGGSTTRARSPSARRSTDLARLVRAPVASLDNRRLLLLTTCVAGRRGVPPRSCRAGNRQRGDASPPASRASRSSACFLVLGPALGLLAPLTGSRGRDGGTSSLARSPRFPHVDDPIDMPVSPPDRPRVPRSRARELAARREGTVRGRGVRGVEAFRDSVRGAMFPNCVGSLRKPVANRTVAPRTTAGACTCLIALTDWASSPLQGTRFAPDPHRGRRRRRLGRRRRLRLPRAGPPRPGTGRHGPRTRAAGREPPDPAAVAPLTPRPLWARRAGIARPSRRRVSDAGGNGT